MGSKINTTQDFVYIYNCIYFIDNYICNASFLSHMAHETFTTESRSLPTSSMMESLEEAPSSFLTSVSSSSKVSFFLRRREVEAGDDWADAEGETEDATSSITDSPLAWDCGY